MKLSSAQVRAMRVLANLGDLTPGPTGRRGLRVTDRTLRSLVRLGLVHEADVPRGEGHFVVAFKLTDAGNIAIDAIS